VSRSPSHLAFARAYLWPLDPIDISPARSPSRCDPHSLSQWSVLSNAAAESKFATPPLGLQPSAHDAWVHNALGADGRVGAMDLGPAAIAINAVSAALGGEARDALEALVDAGLLTAQRERYEVHELIRLYAGDLLTTGERRDGLARLSAIGAGARKFLMPGRGARRKPQTQRSCEPL
jgi:hypothetical protein